MYNSWIVVEGISAPLASLENQSFVKCLIKERQYDVLTGVVLSIIEQSWSPDNYKQVDPSLATPCFQGQRSTHLIG